MPRPQEYPMDELEIDQSFVIPAGHTTAKAVAQLCSDAGYRLGKKFSYRTLPDGAYRVGRVTPAARPNFEIENVPVGPAPVSDESREVERNKVANLLAALNKADLSEEMYERLKRRITHDGEYEEVAAFIGFAL